jgi:hypothetical protein
MSRDGDKPAFPIESSTPTYYGLTIHDWFAGHALSNPTICTGKAETWELTKWFGGARTGITRAEIVTAQAAEAADAMLRERAKS